MRMIDLLSSQMFPPPKYYAIATVICSALCGFVGTQHWYISVDIPLFL